MQPVKGCIEKYESNFKKHHGNTFMKASLKTQTFPSYQEASLLMKCLEDTGIEHTHIESLTGNIVVWAELGSESENGSEVPMNAEFGMHTDHLIVIDGNVINDKVFDEELVNYRLSYRADRVDDLIQWISESRFEHSKTLMIADLITLLSWDDEFVWDNVSTNEFVSPTQNTEYFNAICKDVLKANQRQC